MRSEPRTGEEEVPLFFRISLSQLDHPELYITYRKTSRRGRYQRSSTIPVKMSIVYPGYLLLGRLGEGGFRFVQLPERTSDKKVRSTLLR